MYRSPRKADRHLADNRQLAPRPAGMHPHAMFGLGVTELLVILAIVVLVFGARRLPEIGAGLGKSIKNFKEGVSGKDEIDVTPKKDEVPEGKPPTS